ncbi:hypothetical protein K7640_08240 [Micromonospora sp. PLK6-60]|uniref:hypothetical protein n=1 Tax=Micromonospora sp. PLK6-60 TaxID=2873383 RepID=UPI001CA60BE4|nr:hypothetical protein [Micromonospora sp. PLK6-60]MBY8871828.1 hypothetical protein [Micromonospora sp. PLK6-60]
MPQDPDHVHLYRLLAMLPGPDDQDFWEVVARANGVDLHYIYEKMGHLAHYRRDPAPANNPGYTIATFCTYLIMFFGGEKPEIWRRIAGSLFNVGDNQGGLGARFVADLTDTAWRLTARYRPTNDARLGNWSMAQVRYPSVKD